MIPRVPTNKRVKKKHLPLRTIHAKLKHKAQIKKLNSLFKKLRTYLQ